MGQTYTCQCKLSDPDSLPPDVRDATDKILTYRDELLSAQQADALAAYIAKHDRYFNEPNWTYQETDILERLQELDIPAGYSRAVKDYFEKNPDSLSRLTRSMNLCTRPRFVTTPVPMTTWAPVVSTVTPTVSLAPTFATTTTIPATVSMPFAAPAVGFPCCTTSTVVPTVQHQIATTTYTPPTVVTTTTPSTVYTTTSYYQPARSTTSYTVMPATYVNYY